MRRLPTVGLLAALVVPLRTLGAQQVAPNRATAYLFPTDVSDARAIWVNPAGLGVQREASVYAEFGIGDPGSRGRLRQVNAGFNASGLSFAYQRDILDDGLRGHTYRLGLGGGAGGLAAGFAVAQYRGDRARSTGWDVGISYLVFPRLNVGLVAVNLGEPVVRGLQQRLTFAPAFTWRPPWVEALGVSALGRVTTDSVTSYAFGLSWQGQEGARWPLALIARLDTDRGLRRGAFALGVSIGGQDRLGVVASTPGDLSRLDGVSLFGLTTRQPPARR